MKGSVFVAFIACPAFASLGAFSPLTSLTRSGEQPQSGEQIETPLPSTGSPRPKPRDKSAVRSGSVLDSKPSVLDSKPLYGEIRFAKGPIERPTRAFSGGRHGERRRVQAAGSAGAKVAAALALSVTEKGENKQQAQSAGKSAAPDALAAKVEFRRYGVGDGRLNGAYLGFAPPSQRFELNNVQEVKMEFSTRDEWVKVSLRESESSYQANPSYLFSIGGRNPFGTYLDGKFEQNKARFLFSNQSVGVAGQERVDVKLIDSELVKLTGFAFHSQTDGSYYSDLARRNPNDDFAVSNRQSVGFGDRISLGPVSLTSKFKRTERLAGLNAPSERLQDHTLSLDLEEVWRRFGVGRSALAALSPTSLYGGVFNRSTIFKKLSEGPPVETKGVAAGAHWGWDNGAFDVSYFNYFLNSRRLGDQNYDSSGRGMSASFSAWTDRLLICSGLSLTQADVLPIGASSESRLLDAYASSTLKLEDVPDVFVDLTGARFQYLPQGAKFNTSSWSSSIGLDLSKYLPVLSLGANNAPSSVNFAKASLRALYRYQSGMDYQTGGGGGAQGHFLGFSFRTALN